MDKFFVCLANSYKHGGRCIAGVEVEWKDRWRIVRNEAGLPKWIRPVSRSSSTGEIPNELASGITPLDVVLLNKVVPCGEGAQSENVYFDSMAPIGKRYKSTSVLLERFSDESHKHLFYNYGKTVTPDIFLREGTHSILLIHATLSEVYADTSFDKSPYDAAWLKEEMWTFTALPRIGRQLFPDSFHNIKALIDDMLADPEHDKAIETVRQETWAHIGESASLVVDYMINKSRELPEKSTDD